MSSEEFLKQQTAVDLFMLSEHEINIEDELAQMLNEFAKLKWDEACEAQKKICAERETPHILIGGIEVWEVFAEEEKYFILSSPKAEYK